MCNTQRRKSMSRSGDDFEKFVWIVQRNTVARTQSESQVRLSIKIDILLLTQTETARPKNFPHDGCNYKRKMYTQQYAMSRSGGTNLCLQFTIKMTFLLLYAFFTPNRLLLFWDNSWVGGGSHGPSGVHPHLPGIRTWRAKHSRSSYTYR